MPLTLLATLVVGGWGGAMCGCNDGDGDDDYLNAGNRGHCNSAACMHAGRVHSSRHCVWNLRRVRRGQRAAPNAHGSACCPCSQHSRRAAAAAAHHVEQPGRRRVRRRRVAAAVHERRHQARVGAVQLSKLLDGGASTRASTRAQACVCLLVPACVLHTPACARACACLQQRAAPGWWHAWAATRRSSETPQQQQPRAASHTPCTCRSMSLPAPPPLMMCSKILSDITSWCLPGHGSDTDSAAAAAAVDGSGDSSGDSSGEKQRQLSDKRASICACMQAHAGHVHARFTTRSRCWAARGTAWAATPFQTHGKRGRGRGRGTGLAAGAAWEWGKDGKTARAHEAEAAQSVRRAQGCCMPASSRLARNV